MQRFKSQIISSIALIFICVSPIASADTPKKPVVLEVIDAYAEVHSGPGRGYPVFYTIEQGEKIEILSRRPDWYEIRAENGRIGWTTAGQISRTIQKTGEPADLPSVGYGDYVKNSWVTGFTFGQFADGELQGFDIFSITGGYRFLSWLGADVEFGRFFGSGASGDMTSANIFLEPFSDWKVSPYLSLGTGAMTLGNQPDQPSFKVESSGFNTYGLGASYYLGRNFVIKGEYRSYSINLEKRIGTTDEFEEVTESTATWKLGFSTFF